MKKLTKFITLLLCVFLAMGIIATAASEVDIHHSIGQIWGEYLNNKNQSSRSDVPANAVASYGGITITEFEVEYQRKLGLLTSDESLTDMQIIDEMIKGQMVKHEAERLGLSATAEEIQAYMEAVKASYDYPEGKEIVDGYCEGAGITVEEYYSIVEENLPAIISKQKLRNEIGRQYCEEHGLEFTNINPPQEMLDAIEAYIDELFETHKGDIVYYIDE